MWGASYDVIRFMDYATALANNLKARREDLGLSQRNFARKLGISKSTLDRLENVAQNTTVKTLGVICKSLKCEIGDLFSEAPLDS